MGENPDSVRRSFIIIDDDKVPTGVFVKLKEDFPELGESLKSNDEGGDSNE